MARAKKPAVDYTATLFTESTREVSGTLLEVTESQVVMRYKKPRSSKYLVQAFPRAQVIAIYGNVGDEVGTVVMNLQRTEYDSFEVSGFEFVGDGTVVLTTVDGGTVTVNEANVELIGTESGEAAAAPTGAKKPAAKRKPVVEEDEDDDDEGEDEPAPKKPAAKKPTRKPVVEDDEDDEGDEEPAPKKPAAKKPAPKRKPAEEEEDDDDWS